MARRTTRRIYYGPAGKELESYWTVPVTLARKPININGSLIHALEAHPGVTIGCALSNVAMDPSNKDAIGHPVYLASVTKSTVLLVDKLKKDGSPAHAVQYRHSYGRITDKNDTGTLKKLVKERPSIIERSFTLLPTRERRPTGTHDKPPPVIAPGTAPPRKQFVPRGALKRAVKAGRIGESVAEMMSKRST